MREWRSIETAPNGEMILLADMLAREARYWSFVGWRHSDSAPGYVTTTERVQQPATHWMPLPEPPAD